MRWLGLTIFLLLFCQNVYATDIDSGLVGWWKMNDNAANNTVLDYSGGGNTGGYYNGNGVTATNTSTGSAAGIVNNTSLSFAPGPSIYTTVTVANTAFLPSGNAARTMSAWIKTNGVVHARTEYFGYGGASTYLAFVLASGIAGDGKIYFIGYNYDLQGNKVIGDGNWHHIAVTFDGTTVTLYADGAYDSSAAKSLLNTSNITTYPFIIGREAYSNQYYVYGYIGDVRIYNRALSATDIANLYNYTGRAEGFLNSK